MTACFMLIKLCINYPDGNKFCVKYRLTDLTLQSLTVKKLALEQFEPALKLTSSGKDEGPGKEVDASLYCAPNYLLLQL